MATTTPAGSVERIVRTDSATITLTAHEIDTLMTVMMATGETDEAERRYWTHLNAEGVSREDYRAVFHKIAAADELTTR